MIQTIVVAAFGIIIAFVFLVFRLLSPPKEELKPGKCECGHPRCCHLEGLRACQAAASWNDLKSGCACQIYILKEQVSESELDELRKIAGLEK